METLKSHACFGGRQSFLRHQSEVCGRPMDLSVYLPPQALSGTPCPVVYFLSGLTCTPANFTEKAGAQRVAAELGLIVVAPDTSPRDTGIDGEDDDWDFGTGAGFYVDATVHPWAQHYRMYSYVSAELPRLIEATFPASEARSVLGHSMGGHGALVVGLREPERWRAISALAPVSAPMRCPWGHKAFGRYLGDDREIWKAYDATELLERAQHPEPILVDQGLADGFLDEQLQPELLRAACDASGQALRYRAHEGYDHSYYFIATFIEDHLRHHAQRLTG